MANINIPVIYRDIRMGEFVNKYKLPPSILDSPQEEQLYLGITKWVDKHISSWSEKEKSFVADRMISCCNYAGFVPLLRDIYKPWSAVHRQKQHDMDILYLDKLFDFFKKNNITPTKESYTSLGISSGATKRLFEQLHQAGVMVESKSKIAKNIWLNLLRNTDDDGINAIKHLVKYEIFPDFSDMGHRTYNENIFSVVKKEHDVKALQLVPPDKLKPLIKIKDKMGRSPMHYAAASLLPSYVHLLIDLGAEKHPQDNKGRYPLDMIKRRTSRVENIGVIEQMLGGKTNKTPQEIVDLAIKTLDLTLLNKALDNKNFKGDINTIAFSVLLEPINNTDPRVYKKMRKRKMDMFFYLLKNIDINARDVNGNTYFHIAVERGLTKVVDKLFTLSINFASVTNNLNERADQLEIKEVDEQLDAEKHYNDPYSYHASEYMDKVMQIDTAKKILKIHAKHKAPIDDDSFSVLKEDEEGKALLEKQIMKQNIKKKQKTIKSRKM